MPDPPGDGVRRERRSPRGVWGDDTRDLLIRAYAARLDPPLYYRDVCLFLGKKPQTIYNLMSKHKLPRIRTYVGRSKRPMIVVPLPTYLALRKIIYGY